MEEFRKNFSLYSSVLCFTALWPYDESLLRKTQRVVVSVLILSLLVIQVWTLTLVEISLYNIVLMLSSACPMTLYFLRYVGFLINRSVMRVLFDGLANDYSATRDPVELDIFKRQIIVARRVLLAFLGLTCILLAYMTIVLLIPTILRSKLQLKYLRIVGFTFPETSRLTDWVCIHFVLVNVLGLLSIASTESSVAVSTSYLCGLFEISSYRLEIAINHMLQSTTSDLIQVESAVEFHRRAINTLNYLLRNIIISYLLAIVTVIISFSVNLYRNDNEFANIFFSLNDVLLHFVIMFLNNFSGQRVINTSVEVFNKICSSSWYCIPLRSQKILLFILLRSVKETRCILAGLYDASYEGFSMMMSSSFSYFTVLYSLQ